MLDEMGNWGVFQNNRFMDNLFFKSHELTARDRNGKTGKYLWNINKFSALSYFFSKIRFRYAPAFANDP